MDVKRYNNVMPAEQTEPKNQLSLKIADRTVNITSIAVLSDHRTIFASA